MKLVGLRRLALGAALASMAMAAAAAVYAADDDAEPQQRQASPPGSYTTRGPAAAATIPDAMVTVEASSDACGGKPCTVKARVTFPASASTASGKWQGTPTVFMFNGFQARMGWYRDTAEWLASWGYTVVQYTNSGLLPIIPDRQELLFLPPLLEYVKSLSQDASSPLYRVPDLSLLATLGHSRGGKLAALHAAGNPAIRTAVLLDPVDCSKQTPESADYPSAARALAASNKSVCVVGAGVSGSCNPTDANYKKFYAASAAPSWQQVVLQSGHMQFCRTGNPVLDWGFAKLCGKGSLDSTGVIQLAAPVAVGWLEKEFRGEDPQVVARLADLDAWLKQKAAAGAITFEQKVPSQGQHCPGAAPGGAQHSIKQAREAACVA